MYTQDGKLYIAHSDQPLCMIGKMANRHGLIAGATGTGKTVSLQVIAESFSQAGVPCFMADMKGDLSGVSQPGKLTPFIEKRIAEFGMQTPAFSGCPTRFFDVFGKQGHPLRTTISEMGPTLLSRILDLNETQTGIMNIIFKIADERQLLLIDMKDLRLMLDFVGKNAKMFTTEFGNISPQSIGAIQRALLGLENQGGDEFFGEPAFNINDLLQQENGRGVVNVLAADELMQNPRLYSTFLLWLLSELYTQLPEVGDQPLPKLVFFFDEAHTLFKDTPKAFVDKVEQVVRLIRSKGVGVYFITQIPADIPDSVLGQLGNRVQHALRAFTPKDQKAVRATADAFRANPKFDTEEAILQLATGEALVSFLDEKGAPNMVEKAKILFPLSQIGAITPDQRSQIIRSSRLYGTYDTRIDRRSAYEVLQDQEAEEKKKAEEEKAKAEEQKEQEKEEKASRKGSSGPKSTFEKIIGAAATSFSRQIASSIARSILGSIIRKK
ncbi:MAG: DUF853 family protein [Planctomycetia bacterium]|nr:DUF853 family protein [Planctomycetia bacterium]